MSQRLFPDPTFSAVPVVGSADLYPVHRVFCVGRNYEDHAKEMGDVVDREAPFYFMKDALSVVQSGATTAYPPATANLHHEVELVVYLAAPLFRATPQEAAQAVFGYGIGLDMTRRDVQNVAKSKGRPWDFGKNYEQACVLGDIMPAAQVEMGAQRIWLAVDGAIRQESTLDAMVWSVPEILADLSRYYHLQAGDIVMTGTPAGVGAVVAGNVLTGGIDGIGEISLTIGAAE